MIKRIRNEKGIREQKNKKKYQLLLENLVTLLIKKGILTNEDYKILIKEK